MDIHTVDSCIKLVAKTIALGVELYYIKKGDSSKVFIWLFIMLSF